MKSATASQQARRRQQNLSDFWNARQNAAGSNKDMATVMFDYARAVASKIAGDDPNHPIWYDLSSLLQGWAKQNQSHIP